MKKMPFVSRRAAHQFEETPFSCFRDGLEIRGVEFQEHIAQKPVDGKLPAVIISHGFLSNMKTTTEYAKQFAHWGFAAFVFDFNGGGPKNASDGLFSEMTVYTEKEDLKEVISYVQSLPYIDKDRLILMGCSQGGFVSAMTAAELKDQIHKLILFYPALCIPDDARKGQMMFFKFDPEQIPDEVRGLFTLKLGGCYPKAVVDKQFEDMIAGYEGPVLIVHGDQDQVVDVNYSRRAFEVYTGQRSGDVPPADIQLVILTGANHGFKKKEDVSALSAVREFIHNRTKVLEINVELTDRTIEKGKELIHIGLPFKGDTESPYFAGTIQPGACDNQDWEDRHPLYCCADYTILGTDYAGQSCKIHVVNERIADGPWTPTVTTDSEALSFLNHNRTSAFLENRKQGPVVRIYAPVPR